MFLKQYIRPILLAGASLAALMPRGALAADAAAQAQATGPVGLGEIVVTARRRDENLQKVPVAITAFGAEQMAQRSVVSERDLQSAVPGLVVRASEQQNQLNYAIRGQTIDAFSGSSPGVLTYLNDVQVSGATATTFYDLSGVQVLKGPQGTLFGRNTTGGAVLFNTAKPSNAFRGFITFKAGDFNLKEIQGAIDIPIIADKVQLRVAGDLRDRDGYVRNLNDGRLLGTEDNRSGRVTLVLNPIEALKNTTVVQYSRYGGTALTGELYSVNACGSSNHGVALFSQLACIYNPAFPLWSAFLAANPKAFPGGLSGYLAQQRAQGPYLANMDETGRNYVHSFLATNTTTFNITPDIQIKNILGVTHTVARNGGKLDGSPYDLLDDGPSPGVSIGNLFDTSQWSEEIQLLGKAFDGKLNYIVGFYANSDKERDDYPLSTLQDIGATLAPVFGANPAKFFHYAFVNQDRSEAVFFQDTYDLSDLVKIHGLSLTTGVRYTWENLSLHQSKDSVFYPTFGAAPEKTAESNPSWNISLEYQVSPALLVYVAQRGSWRTGNLNGTSFPTLQPASNFGNLFLPEKTKDVEVGGKFQGSVYNWPVRLNIALYNQWIDNVQRSLYAILGGNPAGFTTNVPSAESTGVEFEGQVKPTQWLQLGVNGAYNDSRYTKASVQLFGSNYTFGPYADAPRWTGSVFAQVSVPLPESWGDFDARTDVYGQSGQYFSNLNNTTNPGSWLPGYSLVNFRFDWRAPTRTGLSAAVFVKNAFDKKYYVGGMPLSGALGLNTAIPGEPRTFGFELSYKFGGK